MQAMLDFESKESLMRYLFLFVTLFAFALIARGQELAESSVPAGAPAAVLPAGHPSVDMAKMDQAAAETQLTEKAQVLSVIEIPQYTFIEIAQGNKTRWLATISVAVKKGDTIRFDTGATMDNFNSRALHRKFQSITFVSRVVVDDGKK